MEPEGITRAWPMVPLMSKKTSATQNHAMISRCTFWPTGTFGCSSFILLRLASASFRLASAFMFHRNRMFRRPFFIVAVHRVTCFIRNSVAHFQLHQVRGVHACVARRAIVASRVVHRLLESSKRNIAQRIGADKRTNFFRGM